MALLFGPILKKRQTMAMSLYATKAVLCGMNGAAQAFDKYPFFSFIKIGESLEFRE